MTQTIEATYEKGVFVPTGKPTLAEHERVRLTIEPIEQQLQALDTIRSRRQNRLCIDPKLAEEIASAPELDLLESP